MASAVKKAFSYLTLAVCLALGAFGIIFSRECAEGIKRGIELSLGQLVPSMFFIMILADFAVKSGILCVGGRIFDRAANFLFGVSSQGMWIILLSLVGGYPVGARLTASMYEENKITSEEASALANVCVCAGPGFLINFVGGFLLLNKTQGAILFAAQASSVLVMAVISKIIFRRKAPKSRIIAENKRMEAGRALVSAVNSSAKVCLSVCAAVTAFSGFTGLIGSIAELGGFSMLIPVFTALAEVTTACKAFAAEVWLPVLGFIVGFGGFCVHFQIFGILSNIKISQPAFLLHRLIQGVLTAVLTAAGLAFCPEAKQAFATVETPPLPSNSATVLGGAALMLTSVFFIFTVWRKRLCAE